MIHKYLLKIRALILGTVNHEKKGNSICEKKILFIVHVSLAVLKLC